ncbi:MAG TPA: MFS transporter [Tahibacter sp.]|uniref:MFS transporter n=1 Tax=Tahibacter sp. TaxID=2056211 RepID=UPI002CBD71F3|nr:MFS transporter [Tahibacter sp.]HSX62735.1 MFS transporter [Tahibacter sp.]
MFMQPIGRDFGIGREYFGFAIAVQNLLFGLAQPFVGAIADRYGVRRVLVVGTLVYAAGLVAASFVLLPGGIMASLGVLVGLGLSGTTFVVVLTGVARLVRPEQRSLAFGLVTAGGSFGQFAVVPMAQAMIAGWGWRGAMLGLGALILVVIVAAFGIRRPVQEGAAVAAADDGGLSRALAQAAAHPHYWLLNAGFFVCGFHIAFIATHFPAYLVDQGIPASVGASALALVGLFNIAGSYLFGLWGGRHSRPRLLAALYGARALAIALFLLAPLSAFSALAFAAVFGFLWLGTVPLTNGAVASLFGVRYLSTLYGIVFLSHQVGSFIGAWAAGRLYDTTGSYMTVWIASIVLGVAASAISYVTRDTPAATPVLRTAGSTA